MGDEFYAANRWTQLYLSILSSLVRVANGQSRDLRFRRGANATFYNSLMPTLISQPTRVEAAGNKPKLIDEYIGRVNSKDSAVSVAHMRSPSGWVEPGQKPEFDEFTIVLRGTLHVESRDGAI